MAGKGYSKTVLKDLVRSMQSLWIEDSGKKTVLVSVVMHTPGNDYVHGNVLIDRKLFMLYMRKLLSDEKV